MTSNRKKAIDSWIKQNIRKNYQEHIANSNILKSNSEELVEILKELNLLQNGITICEIGCGSGRNLSYINKEEFDIYYMGNDLIKEECFKYMDEKLKDKITFFEKDTYDFFDSDYHPDILISSDHLMHLPPSSVEKILERININWCPKYILIRETTVGKSGRKKKWAHDFSVLDVNYKCIFRKISEQNESYPIVVLEKI